MNQKATYQLIALTFLMIAALWPLDAPAAAKADDILWLAKPATNWEKEAFPLGNGRLGCMVFGGVEQERIQFNVDSLWTGDGNYSAWDYAAPGMGFYQNFGDVYVALDAKEPAKSYRRELNISQALCRVAYQQAGTQFSRETFCSHPGQVIVSRLTANARGKYSGHIRLVGGRAEKTTVNANRFTLTGTLANGMEYEAQVLVSAEGGSLK